MKKKKLGKNFLHTRTHFRASTSYMLTVRDTIYQIHVFNKKKTCELKVCHYT